MVLQLESLKLLGENSCKVRFLKDLTLTVYYLYEAGLG
jgi:hypothetical protein